MFAVKHFLGHLGLGTHEPDLDELNSLDRYLRGWSCIGNPSSLYALILDLSLSIYRNISLHINIYIYVVIHLKVLITSFNWKHSSFVLGPARKFVCETETVCFAKVSRTVDRMHHPHCLQYRLLRATTASLLSGVRQETGTAHWLFLHR